uniref:SWIM-type domain-containing protein n=1 Tax=Lactuca sativa TaxID=4236 RepID=A0A9R1WIX9_LACSA|nr:hypothetical protein LSAT_V11C100034980 [Lactuca sativa]
MKLGFKSRNKELLGLDGCFLKGPHRGQILTTVGLDSNSGIYPLAYAVVEDEATSSWTWFLECLGDCNNTNYKLNYMYGIIPAIAKVFPNAKHRWCLRHIHENMKLQWRGEEFRDHLWRFSTNTTIRHFEREMNEFKDFSVEAHEWISKIPPGHWARSHFTSRAHLDCLLNNMCEVLNYKLEHGRDKPIITCLEYIRVYLMKRHCIVPKEVDKCKIILTPTATTIFDTIETIASKYRALFYGSGKYQVTGMMFDQYVVNLKEGTCSCRYWEITGIVCRPGVCAIWEHIQNGACGQNLDVQPLLYPLHIIHKLEGSRKKMRRAIHEPTNQSTYISIKFLSVTCSKCHNKGHSSRTCKGKGVGGSNQGGVGRSSKDAVGGTSQGPVGGSSKVVVGGLRAKKMDTGKKPQESPPQLYGTSDHPPTQEMDHSGKRLLQNQNHLPRLRFVQEVTLIATLPHIQITILARGESFDFLEMDTESKPESNSDEDEDEPIPDVDASVHQERVLHPNHEMYMQEFQRLHDNNRHLHHDYSELYNSDCEIYTKMVEFREELYDFRDNQHVDTILTDMHRVLCLGGQLTRPSYYPQYPHHPLPYNPQFPYNILHNIFLRFRFTILLSSRSRSLPKHRGRCTYLRFMRGTESTSLESIIRNHSWWPRELTLVDSFNKGTSRFSCYYYIAKKFSKIVDAC